MDYELQEGGIALPPGFEDRTVNMFVLGASVPAPLSITISRDTLLPDETLQAYVERQIKMLTSKLRGYSRMGNKAVALSTTALSPASRSTPTTSTRAARCTSARPPSLSAPGVH